MKITRVSSFLAIAYIVSTAGGAGELWAQCTAKQHAACVQDCGPISDVGKVRFAACMNACIKECERKPPTCKNATGAIFPKYYILGLVYAPPGCTSTSTLACSTQSSVNYEAASSMGTKVSTQKSFSSNVSVNVDFGVADVFKFDAGGGYQNVSSDSTSQTVTKGQGLKIGAVGNGDGVDHTQDAFILLLNPAVAVRETQQIVNNECGPPVAQWYLGLSGSSGTQERYTLYVEWLKNPSLMPTNVAQQLQTLGFTTSDYQTILSRDPFSSGSTQIDTSRFIPTTYSFPYEPPLQEADCNNGVCSCLSMAATITNQLQTEVQRESQDQYSLSFKEELSGIDLGIFDFGASSDQKFTWTSTSTNNDTTSNSQSATATVVCPSTTYQGPTIMRIYWDTLFGSFLFVPTTLSSPQFLMLNQGIATAASGKPARHEAVTLSFGGKTYHTWTNNHGDFAFFRPASLPVLHRPTSGELSIKGVRKVVALKSAAKVQIRLP